LIQNEPKDQALRILNSVSAFECEHFNGPLTKVRASRSSRYEMLIHILYASTTESSCQKVERNYSTNSLEGLHNFLLGLCLLDYS